MWVFNLIKKSDHRTKTCVSAHDFWTPDFLCLLSTVARSSKTLILTVIQIEELGYQRRLLSVLLLCSNFGCPPTFARLVAFQGFWPSVFAVVSFIANVHFLITDGERWNFRNTNWEKNCHHRGCRHRSRSGKKSEKSLLPYVWFPPLHDKSKMLSKQKWRQLQRIAACFILRIDQNLIFGKNICVIFGGGKISLTVEASTE